jgi:hypothetical protein
MSVSYEKTWHGCLLLVHLLDSWMYRRGTPSTSYIPVETRCPLMCGLETVFAGAVEVPVGIFGPDLPVLRLPLLVFSKQDAKAGL